jgi:uncharacterized membrane protein YhhN
MSNIWMGITLGIAAVNWWAVFKGQKKFEYFSKPAVIIALLAWLWSTAGISGLLTWFTLGLVFSLVGDVFLMLPPAWFIAGVGSFLIAHLLYIAGFHTLKLVFSVPALVIIIFVVPFFLWYYRRISNGLREKGLTGLRKPIFGYALVINLMLLSAYLTFPSEDWAFLPALYAAAGATLFFLSDSLLAWNRFVDSVPLGPALVMITYHLGQIGLVVGARMNYGGG